MLCEIFSRKRSCISFLNTKTLRLAVYCHLLIASGCRCWRTDYYNTGKVQTFILLKVTSSDCNYAECRSIVICGKKFTSILHPSQFSSFNYYLVEYSLMSGNNVKGQNVQGSTIFWENGRYFQHTVTANFDDL